MKMNRIDELVVSKKNGEVTAADEISRSIVYTMYAEGTKRTGGEGTKAGEIVLTQLIGNCLEMFDGLIIPQGLARVMTGCSEVRAYDFIAVADSLEDELSGETAVVMRLTLPEDKTCDACFCLEPALMTPDSDSFDRDLAEFIETEGIEYHCMNRVVKK